MFKLKYILLVEHSYNRYIWDINKIEQNNKNHYCHYCCIEKDRIVLLKILGLLKDY